MALSATFLEQFRAFVHQCTLGFSGKQRVDRGEDRLRWLDRQGWARGAMTERSDFPYLIKLYDAPTKAQRMIDASSLMSHIWKHLRRKIVTSTFPTELLCRQFSAQLLDNYLLYHHFSS